MDIRKFFSPLSSTSSSQSRKSSSSDAEFKVVKHKESGRKDTKKRRKAVIESDSDEEPLPKHIKLKEDEKKRKKKMPDKAPTKVTKSPKKKPSPLKYTPLDIKKSKPQDKPKPKLVDVADFFGAAPIQRSSQKVLNNKRKNDDIDLHDDEDFKATLKQLDEQERTRKKLHFKEENTVMDKQSKKEEHVLTPTEASTSKSLLSSAENGEKEKTPSSEQKKGNAVAYRQYLQREGPRALGSKEMPKGAENCLLGLTFVITGILDSLERDEAADLIKEYGGKVTQSISKNTSYIVLGRDPGPAKIEKAKSLGTKQVDEDELLELIRTLPGHNSTKSKNKLKESKQKNADEVKERQRPEVSPISKKKVVEIQMKAEPENFLFQSVKSPSPAVEVPMVNRKNDAVVVRVQKCTSSPESSEFMMWVDKYKPRSLKCLIGQQGDRSNANKLVTWLKSWHKNHGHSAGGSKKKPFIGRWGGAADDGSSFKAALLSGSPGIGKTTTAQLTCKECGFSFVEMNASDTRSKRSLQEHVSEMLGSTSVSGFFSDGDPEKHCLLMDEVDGMAGNEDRGGVQELIQLIKSSKVPIICMCNDRNHPKIRSLANYCFDLRFQKPRVEQIKGAMMSIAYKEGVTISPQALQEIIVGANQDVRQILHLLSVFSAKSKSVDFEQTKLDAKNARKDIKKGPFDVVRMVFSASEHKTMSLYDKSDLFFHDYSIGPLFVQENYVCVEPHAARSDKKKVMELLSQTAECICYGDLVDRVIRSQNAWNLLPVQALYASVMPGEKMEGHLTGMITFPTWLGRNSTRNKTNRILQELLMHMRLRVSANKTDLNCDYLPSVRDAIVKPLLHLQQDGVSDAVHVMTDYYLMREDIDSLMEVTLWPGEENSFSKIDSKVKAAFTRAYNKDAHLNPYSIIVAPKKKRGEISEGDFLVEEGVSGGEGDEDLESSDSDLASDAMVKLKKPLARKRKHEDEPSTSKKANAAVKSSATAGKRKKK